MKAASVIASVFLVVSSVTAGNIVMAPLPEGGADVRPEPAWETLDAGSLWSAFMNIGWFGDPFTNYPSMEWPGGSGSDYLWLGDVWATCYGEVTPSPAETSWVSNSAYNGDLELYPSDESPIWFEEPGVFSDQTVGYTVDDWYLMENPDPMGLKIEMEIYAWDQPGYENVIGCHMVITHDSEQGSPGTALDGLVIGVRGDCDVATADTSDANLDDMVFYDGHAIWCNDPQASFEYEFDDGTPASEADWFTWQQNPEGGGIWYHYNYPDGEGFPDPDGLVDADVDADGVSDHFTLLAKVCGGDTTYITDPESGVTLFEGALPGEHWSHVVGDTTYLVLPRNTSYMWDGDHPGSAEDDSGEPLLDPMCTGFLGWRLMDCWITDENGISQGPVDVHGVPVPLSHCWWNWESDPGTDPEKYQYIWGENPDLSGRHSGPSYLSDWVGNPNTPKAFEPENPGPFPVVHQVPSGLGYPVFDYRFLLGIGPVTLDDDDTLHIVGGWAIGEGLDGLRTSADLLLDAYWRQSVWGGGATGIEGGGPLPDAGGLQTTLAPNPTTGMAAIGVALDEALGVSVDVFDMTGRKVAGCSDPEEAAGRRTVSLDLSPLAPGVYLYRVEAGDRWASGRVVVAR